MSWLIEETRKSVKRHGRIRTALFILTTPIRLPLVLLGIGMTWLGGHISEDYLGALIAGRIFHDED